MGRSLELMVKQQVRATVRRPGVVEDSGRQQNNQELGRPGKVNTRQGVSCVQQVMGKHNHPLAMSGVGGGHNSDGAG